MLWGDGDGDDIEPAITSIILSAAIYLTRHDLSLHDDKIIGNIYSTWPKQQH